MTPWIVLAGYVVGYLISLRIVLRLDSDPDDEDRWMAVPIMLFWPFWAVAAAVMGVVVGAGWCAYQLATMDLPKPRNPFRRRIKDGDPQRIAELEFELGLTDTAPSDYFKSPQVGRVEMVRIGHEDYEVHVRNGQPIRYVKAGGDR